MKVGNALLISLMTVNIYDFNLLGLVEELTYNGNNPRCYSTFFMSS